MAAQEEMEAEAELEQEAAAQEEMAYLMSLFPAITWTCKASMLLTTPASVEKEQEASAQVARAAVEETVAMAAMQMAESVSMQASAMSA
jgi:hypothetical protein